MKQKKEDEAKRARNRFAQSRKPEPNPYQGDVAAMFEQMQKANPKEKPFQDKNAFMRSLLVSYLLTILRIPLGPVLQMIDDGSYPFWGKNISGT